MNKLLKPHSQSLRRTVTDPAVKLSDVKWIRERGLDHAVEREKNLKPLLNIKNLIKSEPSKSLPITIITQQKDSLKVPIRPIEFIRKYPSVFQEFHPGNVGVQPHIKLTPEVLDIDADEQLVYQSESYRRVVADRLLKLLMISQMNKLPLTVIDVLKWDIGLSDDFVSSVVPEFPDYFRVVGYRNKHECYSGSDLFGELELVCWSNELAVSVVEKKAKAKGIDLENIVFLMNFSSGCEMDKKMKKWVDDWQKLPYISPYENATHLLPKSDESDKWAVAIMHEAISLFGAKKVEREKLLRFGNYLGIRSWFKRALLNHPGIFYVSNKSGAYTVVLKEAYKRGALIDSDPLMNVRSQYIHLMNMVKEEKKVIAVPGESKEQEKGMPLESKGEEKEDVDDGDEDSEEDNDVESSDDEEEDASDDDSEDYDDEEEEGRHRKGASRSAGTRRERTTRKMKFDDDSEDYDGEEEEGKNKRGASRNFGTSRGRTTRKMNWDVKGDSGNSMRNHHGETRKKVPPKYTERREMQGETNGRWNSGERKYSGRREVQDENNGRWNSGERKYTGRRETLGNGCWNSGERKYSGRRDTHGEDNGRWNSGERKYSGRRETHGENNGRWNSGERKSTGRREMQGENNGRCNSGERLNFNRGRRLSTEKKTSD